MSTICAISTAPGVGGIAVVRVSGPDAFKICDRIFRPKKVGKSLSTQKAYTLTYGSIVGNNDETIDEVIAAVFRAPILSRGRYGGNHLPRLDVYPTTNPAIPYLQRMPYSATG